VIEDNKSSFASLSDGDRDYLIMVSRSLRRDRELSFYGSEDLTPSEFYRKSDADLAKSQAAQVLAIVRTQIPKS
jgi:hypothetical protein